MLLPAEFYFKAAQLEPDAAHYDNPDYFTGYMKAIRDIMKLLDEMEAIVYSGTKLDISYYLEDVMDEDYMLDIYDYFHDESETDRLSVAIKTLGPDYDENDIRLVRIKFLSELAN